MNPQQICGYTWSFFRPLGARQTSSIDVVRFFVDLGLKRIEVADPFLDSEQLAAINDLIHDAGLTVACYDIFGEFCVGERVKRKSQLDDVRRALERAKSIGAVNALVLPGPVDDGIPMEVARSWYIEGLTDCLPLARELGITLTIANLGSQASLCGALAHILEISSEVGPELRLTYDVGNFMMAGEETLEALDRIADRVVHVHLKDWDILSPSQSCLEDGNYVGVEDKCFRSMPLGQGVVDLAGAVGRLTKMGYTGSISVEYEGVGEPKLAVKHGVRFLESLIASTI